jgi:hypothetical protein
MIETCMSGTDVRGRMAAHHGAPPRTLALSRMEHRKINATPNMLNYS